MKRLLVLLLLINFFWLNGQKVKPVAKQPKIGLSLSGGGAKGFSHIGVLKVIDSLGIKIDYIAGTSMGAIVGGLYAAGYSGEDLEQIMLDTDFYNVLSNQITRQEETFFNKSVGKYLVNLRLNGGKINFPSSISTGQKNIYLLKELFKHVSNITDFSKLPIPFMAIGTNLETGKTVYFEEGDLPQAIMASSAFPSLMNPVKIGDSIYIDGAMTINYPSKPLKDKGIDYVIGVDLSQGLAKKEDLTNIISIFNQVIDFGIQKETQNQLSYTDLSIKPDLEGLGVTSFDEKQKIMRAGETAALEHVDALNKLPKRIFERQNLPLSTIYSSIYKIDRLDLLNNDIYNEDYVLGKMQLRIPSLQTYESINTMIDKLYATNNYRIINYDIVQEGSQNVLKIDVSEDQSRNFLKLGLHYDEIFKTGLLGNITLKRLFFTNSTLSFDAVVGDKPRYYLNYFIDNGYIPGFGVYASGMTFNLKNEFGNETEKIGWIRNEAFIQSVWRDRYALGLGLGHDYYSTLALFTNDRKTDNYINPFIFLRSDTQNDRSFPTSGFFTNIELKSHHVFESEEKAFQVKADLRGNFPINSWLTYRLVTNYGLTINEVDPVYDFRLGGIFDQPLGNFVRFEGYELGQHRGKNLIKVNNYFQFNVYKNYYLIANYNMANLFDNFQDENLFKIRYQSAGITAAYKSPLGQVKLNYSHPINDNRGIFSVILGHWF